MEEQNLQDKWFLLLNPEAGSGKGRKMLPWIESALRKARVAYSVYLTRSPGDAINAAEKAINQGYEKIIAAGGDGTFHEVCNGIIRQKRIPSADVMLALIPIGTGNDWPKTWNISTNIQTAVSLLLQPRTQVLPAGRIEYTSGEQIRQVWFANVAGCGFDAAVAQAANEAKKQGKSGVFTYIAQLVLCLFRYRESPAIIRINNQEFRTNLFTVLAGMGKYAGKGMKLLPLANPLSGQFSITLVQQISRWKIILNIAKLYKGSFVRMKEVSIHQGTELHIQAGSNIHLQADGESLGTCPVSMIFFPDKIRLVVPA